MGVPAARARPPPRPRQTTTQEEAELPSSPQTACHTLGSHLLLQECASAGVAATLLPVSTAKVVFSNKRNA